MDNRQYLSLSSFPFRSISFLHSLHPSILRSHSLIPCGTAIGAGIGGLLGGMVGGYGGGKGGENFDSSERQ